MKGWRGQPNRHALAARGISIVKRPNSEPLRITVRQPVQAESPPVEALCVGDVYEKIITNAFMDQDAEGGSFAAEALLNDRRWLLAAIHAECSELGLSVAESAQLENDLLDAFGQKPDPIAGLIQVIDKIAPKSAPPTQEVSQ